MCSILQRNFISALGTTDNYRPDIVLFVNGIPLCVIECKRPDIKDSLGQAISQHLRNQKEDGIRSLYVYSALLLSIATSSASYATTATPAKFWSKWREQFLNKQGEDEYKNSLLKLVNTRVLTNKITFLLVFVMSALL